MKNMKPFRNLLPALFTAFLLTLIQGWGNTAQAQTTYPVLFRVDLSDYNGSTPINGVFLNGTFNAWCGSCAPMTDANNDSVWELTVPLAADTFEYKFTINGWSAQETLIPGSSCTFTAFGFTNRKLLSAVPSAFRPLVTAPAIPAPALPVRAAYASRWI
jgi:1,4-alpha-glucan branching enzyme